MVHPYLDWPGPIPLAHRGGASEAPENTLPAFRRAYESGYRYLETDVHATADGVLVAFHDDDLSRTCGRPERISDLPWSELATCLVDDREPIPRMDELVEELPEARWNIDCKADSAVDALVELLGRIDLERVCVSSFDDRRTRRVRRRFGERLCVGTGQINIALVKILGWTPWHADVNQVPLRHGPFTVLTERFIARSHRLGMPVHVWTIDDPDEMERLLDLGVDGLITDRPLVLKDVLERRGEWVTP